MERIKRMVKHFAPHAYHLGHIGYFGLVAVFAHGPYAIMAGGLMVLGLVVFFLGELGD